MSRAYNQPPSEIYGVKGAVGLFFDKGIYYFGKYVEGVVERAGEDALNSTFARSAQARAFAQLMGDDMEKSSVGFANPFSGAETSTIPVDENGDEIIDSGY